MKQQNYRQLKYNQPKQSIVQFGEMQSERIVRWLFSIGTVLMVIKSLLKWINFSYSFSDMAPYPFDNMSMNMPMWNMIFFDMIYLIALIAIWYIICQAIYLILEAVDVWRRKNQVQLKKLNAQEYDFDL